MFYLIIELNTKVKFLKDFYNNNTTIQIYIDTNSIRVEIENIRYVIQ